MRDAALSMRTLMFTNSDSSLVDAKMRSYVSWVLQVQNEPDPRGQDVRSELTWDLSPRLFNLFMTVRVCIYICVYVCMCTHV
jgi:hypothetical protein